jgi:hypothetical protein
MWNCGGFIVTGYGAVRWDCFSAMRAWLASNLSRNDNGDEI